MSVNTGKLGDSSECVRVCEAGAALDEQRADLSPSQTLLIKAGNVCNLSSLTLLAVFLCRPLLHFNALFLFVLLAFFFLSIVFSFHTQNAFFTICVCVSLSLLLCMFC